MKLPIAEKIAIGTVQFGMAYGIANQSGQVAESEVARILDIASRLGVRTLDTAIAYGDSELVLGNQGVARFDVVTKVPQVPDDVPDPKAWVVSQVEASLVRTCVSRYAGILLHAPHQLFNLNGGAIVSGLEEVKRNGWATKIGVSVYSVEEALRCREAMDVDLVQLPVNVADRRSRSDRLVLLKRVSVEIHARSAYLQGLLLMESGVPAKFTRWSAQLGALRDWMSMQGLSPIEACLRYVAGLPEVDRLVIGVDNADQLQQALDAMGPAIQVPTELQMEDEMLLNPMHWGRL